MTDTELLSSYMPKRTELQAKLISVPVNQIHHGTRFRSDLGDIEGLAEQHPRERPVAAHRRR